MPQERRERTVRNHSPVGVWQNQADHVSVEGRDVQQGGGAFRHVCVQQHCKNMNELPCSLAREPFFFVFSWFCCLSFGFRVHGVCEFFNVNEGSVSKGGTWNS
jgi:hypothetical protein